MPLPNPGMSFTPFDPLPASELNDIVENVESLSDGTGFATGAVLEATLEFSGAKVTKSVAQTINNTTATIVAFGSEVYDTGGYHDNSTNNSRLTITDTGYYSVGVILNWETWSGSSRLIVSLKKNGVIFEELYDQDVVSGSDVSQSFMVDVIATAADYFEIEVYQTTGAGRNLAATTKFTIKKNGE